MPQKINTLVGATYIGCLFTGSAHLIAVALSLGSLALARMERRP